MLPYSYYDKPRQSEGVWAPSIRYHNGKLWVFFATPDDGIFMSTTEDPFGKWSPLHLVKKTKGWIDPCPFWDDDGNAYLVHAFANSRIGFKSVLNICKMKQDGTALLDEGLRVFDGNLHHPTIEGPKMYKRNGYYYIFAPAGGVTNGWQTVLRSKNIYGPYEDKVVLHQGSTLVNGPHQGAWVELEISESWFIHFQDKGPYGRITHLQPLRWEDDWPVIGNNVNAEGVGEPVMSWKKPTTAFVGEECTPQTSDIFEDSSLGLQWQWRANIQREWYDLREGRLRLHAHKRTEETDTFYDTAQILTQKFPALAFTVTTHLTFSADSEGDTAGLMVFGHDYTGIKLKKSLSGMSLIKFIGQQRDERTVEQELFVLEVDTSTLYLRVEVKEGARCEFSFSIDGDNFQLIDFPFQAKDGGWSGAQLGIFCLNEGGEHSVGYADYHSFYIEAKEGG
jgi:beta-xylosidase